MKVAFYTLGCKVNQYETQALKESFTAKGYEVVEENEFADVYVVNTCTVTGLADRKSRQYIRRMKKVNPDSVTAVIGCYAQMSPEEVKAIEGVSIVAGTNEKTHLLDYVESYLEKAKRRTAPPSMDTQDADTYIKTYEELSVYEETGYITEMEARTRAFIKIQEGCDQFCSYCIIPFARGTNRSREISEIHGEAENLLMNGFKELVLTGINTALYGLDKETDSPSDLPKGIEAVLADLSLIPGDFRIRLGSLEPTVIHAEKVQSLLTYPKLCPHMHLSLQSGSDSVLLRMNRHYTRQDYAEIVHTLRRHDPWYGITTDLIVGFPGETEEEFLETLRMVEELKFLKVHIFPYSKRPGTQAAAMKEQIQEHVKKERCKRLQQVAKTATEDFITSAIGTKRQVLFEEYDETTGKIVGFADNYMKVYSKVTDLKQAESLLHRFVTAELIQPYQEGVLTKC